MNARRLKGLFINCVAAQDSIHESGKMAFQSLSGSEKYSLDYIEITPDNLQIPAAYDFYFFNYHMVTMAWLDTVSLKDSLPGVKFTLVLEVSPNNPFAYCSPEDFDAYCVLDPTLNIAAENVFAFPRPLEVFDEKIEVESPDVPVIGSFGFATKGKGFEHLIDAVNREFERALVRINIPYSQYEDASGIYAKELARMCRNKAKAGVEVVVTHDFMNKTDLIEWCAKNTINCFLYDRNVPGLAATTDQAISSGRPLAVSKNNTFRHIQKYVRPFPYQTLKQAIENTLPNVAALQNDWSPENFRKRFEEVLDDFQFADAPPNRTDKIALQKKNPRGDFLAQMKKKLKLRIRLRHFGKIVGLSGEKSAVAYSLFGEDVIVRDLLKKLSVQNAAYLDIGAGNTETSSSTLLFYQTGYSGVLIEPNAEASEKLKSVRPRDTILNIGVDEAVSTINEIIARRFTECPDFVSLNMRDGNQQILENFDFEKYNPAIFCLGKFADESSDEMCRKFFAGKGYFLFTETEANNIFVNKNLYDFYLYQQSQSAKK